MSSQPKTFHPIFLSIAAFFLCLFIVFVSGEIYYRFFYDTTDSFGLTKVTRRWFERYYRSNSINVRDSIEYYLKRNPKRLRVTFLGDSFTAGHGVKNVENRFANIIRRAKDPEWEIHVLAKNGADTGEELELIEKILHQGYASDLVVLVYVLNDVTDIIPEWRAIHARIFKGIYNQPFLIKHSFFLNTWYYRLRGMRDPDISNYYHFVEGAYQGKTWEVQKRRLAELKASLDKAGIRLAAVTFPFLHQPSSDYEYTEVHRQLDAFWKEQQVPHLDLAGLYSDYQPRQITVSRFDAHPNELAHRLAANAILKFLEPLVKPSESNAA